MDNDCDWLVDEELQDGLDNDGDGLVDEDVAANIAYIPMERIPKNQDGFSPAADSEV